MSAKPDASFLTAAAGLDAIERGPQRANCDCGDDEEVEEAERAMGGRTYEQFMEAECGYHGSDRK